MMTRLSRLFFLLVVLAILSVAPMTMASSRAEPAVTQKLYMPLVQDSAPLWNPFLVEAYPYQLVSNPLRARAQELHTGWARLNSMSWREVQPTRGAPYDWSTMAGFEAEILALNEVGITPVVIVDDYPAWATEDPTYSCGALRADRLADYAAFLSAMVTRYSNPPFNIHNWEMGNEPDVDPMFVPSNAVWGCWGDVDAPYYGGERYGNMLKAVVPGMRAADSSVRIWLGGLLLNTYQTTTPGHGRPELFLEGVLRAGAAPYFDILPYHAHSSYSGRFVDYSGAGGGWSPYGGPAVGKPAYLRSILARYGVDKPLFLNESALGCNEALAVCGNNPQPEFYEAQADHVVRLFVRTLHQGVKGVGWYTLNGPGWRHGGLLDGNREPRPAFYAYRTLADQIRRTTMPPTRVEYHPSLEAYRFRHKAEAVDVLWSPQGTQVTVAVPQGSFIAAYTRDGDPKSTSVVNGQVRILIGFSPVYIQRLP